MIDRSYDSRVYAVDTLGVRSELDAVSWSVTREVSLNSPVRNNSTAMLPATAQLTLLSDYNEEQQRYAWNPFSMMTTNPRMFLEGLKIEIWAGTDDGHSEPESNSLRLVFRGFAERVNGDLQGDTIELDLVGEQARGLSSNFFHRAMINDRDYDTVETWQGDDKRFSARRKISWSPVRKHLGNKVHTNPDQTNTRTGGNQFSILQFTSMAPIRMGELEGKDIWRGRNANGTTFINSFENKLGSGVLIRRALRAAGIGNTPSLERATLFSIPLEQGCLEPELGAYKKYYADDHYTGGITYGLTRDFFNEAFITAELANGRGPYGSSALLELRHENLTSLRIRVMLTDYTEDTVTYTVSNVNSGSNASITVPVDATINKNRVALYSVGQSSWRIRSMGVDSDPIPGGFPQKYNIIGSDNSTFTDPLAEADAIGFQYRKQLGNFVGYYEIHAIGFVEGIHGSSGGGTMAQNTALNQKRNLVFNAKNTKLAATKFVNETSVIDFVNEWGQSTCSPMWLTRDGVLYIGAIDTLSKYRTEFDHTLMPGDWEFGTNKWSIENTDVPSVSLKYSEPNVFKNNQATRITLTQQLTEVEGGLSTGTFKPADDEDWHGVSVYPKVNDWISTRAIELIPEAGLGPQYYDADNMGRAIGTWLIGSTIEDDGKPYTSYNPFKNFVYGTMDKISMPEERKYEVDFISGGFTMLETNLAPHRPSGSGGSTLSPIIRGKGLVKWVEKGTTNLQNGTSSPGPHQKEININYHSGTEAQNGTQTTEYSDTIPIIRTFLERERLRLRFNPQMSEIKIKPNLDIELGHSLRLSHDGGQQFLSGISMIGSVIKEVLSMSNGVLSQTITLIPIDKTADVSGFYSYPEGY